MRISQREKSLLGYSPSQSSPNDRNYSPIDPNLVPGLDFSDVFGGPPRRFSFQDIQRSDVKSRSFDAVDEDDDDDDKAVASGYPSRSAGYGGGRPVFGDEVVNRRPYRVSQDFFDDIYGGNQSAVSSPKMVPRDPFASSPGSRVLSPAWPLPPRPEPSGSFAQFSLPARLANSDSTAAPITNLSSYRTWDSIASPWPRFSSHNVLQEDTLSLPHQIPLSRESSFGSQGTEGDPKPGIEGRNIVDQDLNRLEFLNDSRRFHFSIHKWASKEVPLLTSLRRRSGPKSKEKNTIGRSSSSNRRVESEFKKNEVLISIGSVSSSKSGMSAGSSVKVEEQVHASFDGNTAYENLKVGNKKDEEVASTPLRTILSSLLSVDFEEPENVVPSALEEELPAYSHKPPVAKERGASAPVINIVKPDLHPLRSSATNIEDEQGIAENGKVTAEDQGKETFAENKDEKYIDIDNASSSKGDISRLQQQLKSSGDQDGKTGGHGKVKEFVKIFNQESALKPTTSARANRRSNRLRERRVFKVEHDMEVSSTIKLDETLSSEISGKQVGGAHKPATRQQPDVENTHTVSNTSSSQEDYSEETNAPITEVLEPTIIDIDLDEILMLPEELEKPSADSKHQSEAEVSESEIRKWSKGKEGNIRALLSTLQYILWPNSGWKPVALVDIIEGNAVKRAYQKALLCLHPDKLQQKGADSHHKYIAEKVLDMLQEAWDHFNALGSL